MRLLIVDDVPSVVAPVVDLFTSPLWSISTARSLTEAKKTIGPRTKQWHCWILDIALGEHESGLELLRYRPDFKFAVVLSGLHSMSLSADAVKRGARNVLDKHPDNFDTLYNEVCLNAALACTLTTTPQQYLPVFSHLQTDFMTDIDQWAEKACYTVRSLERICTQHTRLPPRKAMRLFYGLYYILWYGDPAFPMKPAPGVPGPQPGDVSYLKSCAATVVKHTLLAAR